MDFLSANSAKIDAGKGVIEICNAFGVAAQIHRLSSRSRRDRALGNRLSYVSVEGPGKELGHDSSTRSRDNKQPKEIRKSGKGGSVLWSSIQELRELKAKVGSAAIKDKGVVGTEPECSANRVGRCLGFLNDATMGDAKGSSAAAPTKAAADVNSWLSSFSTSHVETVANKAKLRVRADAAENIHASQKKDKGRYDNKQRDVNYAVGDLMKIYTPIRRVGKSDKLQCRYFGPYKVIRRVSPVNYVVSRGEGARAKTDRVHVSRMSPFYAPWDPGAGNLV